MRGLAVEHFGGRGPRLVLVHGFTQTARTWAKVARRLVPDYEVLAVDAPGHGGSADVDADLVQTARLLVDAAGVATYVGYSMGGRMALHAALEHPQQVRRLVLLGATAGIEDDEERAARRADDEALAQLLEVEGLDAFLRRWLAGPLFSGLDAETAGLAERRRNSATGLAASLRRAGTGSQQDLWPRLGTLPMPVLVLVGEYDAKFGPIAARMATAIGPAAELGMVPGAGHAAHLEQPDAFAAVLRRWLEAHPPSASPAASTAP